MKKITCESCSKRSQTMSASWVVFDSVVVCEDCRLAVINWFCAHGIPLGNVFVDEFMDMRGFQSVRVRRLDEQSP